MKRPALLLLAAAAACGALSAKPLDPQRWRDEYVAEPARRAMLERYTTPMERETQTALRTLTLAKLIAARCEGSAFDPDIVRDYAAESGLARLPEDDIDLTANIVGAESDYFDLTRLKTVCARAGRLFGGRGELVPSLVSPGLGFPVRSEPRAEHWIAVEPFLVGIDGRTRMLGREDAPRRLPVPRRRAVVDRRAADPVRAPGAPGPAL